MKELPGWYVKTSYRWILHNAHRYVYNIWSLCLYLPLIKAINHHVKVLIRNKVIRQA